MKKALVIPRYYYANAMIQGLEPGSDDNTYCHRLHTYDPENCVSVVGGFGTHGLTTPPFKLMDRSHCETNPTYLQLIPYVILVSKNQEVFIYKRGQKGNEDRLHQLYSVGLGGHIEIDTPPEEYVYVQPERILPTIIAETIKQELQEEVGIELTNAEISSLADNLPHFHTIYSDHNQVGSVHLGISGILKIEKDRLNGHEKDIIQNGCWVPIENVQQYLKEQNGEFEEWSDICMGIFEQGIEYAVVDLGSIDETALDDLPNDLRDEDFEG